MQITWEGDLEDDCSARFQGMLAHCEFLYGPEDFDDEVDVQPTWFVGIYRDCETIFHGTSEGVCPESGEAARRLAEIVMKGQV